MHILRRYWYVFMLVFALLIILLGLLLGGWIGDQFFPRPRSASSLSSLTGTPAQTAKTSGPTASPTTYKPNGHLIIPTIGVNAAIEPVGVLADGNLAVPTQKPWDGVGWYRNGPYPGAQGSAVIDGHLDRPKGLPAVFWKLRDLHVGDIITIVNPGEMPLHFRVLESKYYVANTAPSQKIFGNNAGNFLNLITCAGQWIPNQHQTTLRLVVYTVLV